MQMNKTFKTICLSFLAVIILSSCFVGSLETTEASSVRAIAEQSGASSSSTELDFGHGGVPNSSKATSFKDILRIAISILLGLATTVAIIFIIVGGYQYMMPSSSSKEGAKKTIGWAVAGLIVIILAAVIVNTTIGLFG